MKFKNITDKVINMKLDEVWNPVEAGEMIELSESIGNRQEGLVSEGKEEVKEEPKAEPKEVEEPEDLSKCTKDQLNDYAAKIGLDEINSSMKKGEMIKRIKEFQGKSEEPKEEEEPEKEEEKLTEDKPKEEEPKEEEKLEEE